MGWINVGNCPVCGKRFTGSENKKYCGAYCRNKAGKAKRIGKELTVPGKRKKMTIEDIDAEARKAGLSYGKYVAMMKL